jgi:glycosyltransferase involved in cell wall biosynthesis
MPKISKALTLEDLPPFPPDKAGWPWTQASQPLPEQMPDGSEWPRISIVTPSYNQGEFIEETIRSVLLQGYPNLEYLIIDGGSTDDSLEIIKKYQNYISYWVSETDQGPADAINKGWQKASGKILAYLNSDDAYLPSALATVAETFQNNPDAKVVSGNELKIDKEGLVIEKTHITPKNIDRLSLLNLNFISQPATFIEKSTLVLIEGLDLNIKYTFDFELWLRITRFSCIKIISNVLAVTRWHDNTITHTKRYEIGKELVHIITKEITFYFKDLNHQEKQHILFLVNHLTMDLYFESQKPWGALKYALTAWWLAPNFISRYCIVKYCCKKIVQKSQISLKDKYFSTSMKNYHWSSTVKAELTKNETYN